MALTVAAGANAPIRLGGLLGASGGSGGLKLALVNVVGDAAYPLGGWQNVTPILEAAGLDIVNRIYGMLPITQLGYDWDYIPATDRLKVYQQPAAAAAGASPESPANAANLNGLTVLFLVLYE